MSQPIKNGKTGSKPPKKPKKAQNRVFKKKTIKKNHPEYGTSKLEVKFAKEFLDKLNVKYVYQFKAASIGRYFDYYLPNNNILIEVDGDYYHSRGILYEDMSPMQKHNKRVDKQKDHWALINGFKLLRIWEYDINKNPNKVMELLKKELVEGRQMKIKEDKKKIRH